MIVWLINLMKHTKLALTALMVVAIGLTGANLVNSSISQPSQDFQAMGETGSFMGHITLVQKDAQGNILKYIQTDNVVVNEGKDCALELIFGAGGTCPAASATEKFDKIALFSGQTFAHTANATTGGGLAAVDLTDSGLVSATGAVQTFVAAVGTGYGTTSTGGSVEIFKQFTLGAGNGITVDGAVLWNNLETAAFAAQNFGLVTLNLSDTLDVTWTITLGTTT